MTQPPQADGQESVTFTIDDRQITVPKGTLIIRAAEQLGIEIPRFCDHPLLDPVAWCRQCMVEVEGHSYAEASSVLGISEEAARTRAARARRRLRADLEGALDD